MSTLIKIYPKAILFRKLSDPGPPCIPLYRGNGRNGGEISLIPQQQEGSICQLVTINNKAIYKCFRRDKQAVVECLLKKDADVTYIQVIHRDLVGWVLLSHIKELYTIELDPQGEPTEKLVYRSEDNEQD